MLLVGYTDATAMLLTRTDVVTGTARTAPADTTLTCFRVWGLGVGVWGLGFGVWGLGFRV